MKEKISWDVYALKLAEVASLRSPDPYRKVGCSVLDSENRVISLGYNGLAKGKEVFSSFWEDRNKRRPFMIHAEMNALALIKRGSGKLLASTLLPCSCCANVIAAHGIQKVIFSDIYENDCSAFDIFNFHGIEISRISLDEFKKSDNLIPD